MLDQSMKLKALEAYELVEEREIKELNSIGYILEHKKTGAKVFLMSADDDNKVFFADFRKYFPLKAKKRTPLGENEEVKRDFFRIFYETYRFYNSNVL